MALTDEQKELRRGRIGSSDIAAIVGLNPWKRPIDVWQRLTGRSEEEENVEQTSAGTRLEPIVAQWYSEEHSVALSPGITLVRDDWKVATPDFLVLRSPAIVEVKVVGPRLVHHWGDDTPPDYVVAQCLWQAHVTGIEAIDVAVLLGGTRFAAFHVPFYVEVLRDILEIAESFYREYVVKDVPPPVDASDSWRAYVTRRFPEELEPMAIANDEAETLALQLDDARQRQHKAELDRAEYETALKLLVGNRAGLRGRNWQVTWKTNAQGAPKWKTIAEALRPSDELINRHRSKPARTFKFKKESEDD